MRPKFKIGDVVTWGFKRVAHRVIAVTEFGVVVDSTSSDFGAIDDHGRRTMLIEFAPGSKSNRCPGPPILASHMEPDKR
jgi:hypothetical protein